MPNPPGLGFPLSFRRRVVVLREPRTRNTISDADGNIVRATQLYYKVVVYRYLI